MSSLADKIRVVPETAVRLYLGARVAPGSNGTVVVELDGRTYSVAEDVLEDAALVAKALSVRPRVVQYATDVLELRHHAEDLFLEKIAGTKDLPKILFVPAQGLLASSFYRAMLPADMMNEAGLAVANFTERLDLAKALRYDILWIQLASAPMLYGIAETAKKEGLKIVYDVDDRFDAVPGDNPAAAVYVEQKVEAVWKIIELADLVTVTTDYLKNYVETRAPGKVRVLRNMIPASIAQRRALPPRDFTRILWAGSPTHKRDLAVVAPALRDMLAERRGRVRFTLFGEQLPRELQDVEAFVDLRPFVPFVDYMDALAGAGAHFAIAPLADDGFNAAKSAVKAVEYAACGYACLMSPVGEYPELVKDGFSGILVKDEDWRAALEAAVVSPVVMEKRGEESREWVYKNRCIVRSKGKEWAEVARELVAVPAR